MRRDRVQSRRAALVLPLAACLGLSGLLALPALASGPAAGSRYVGVSSQDRRVTARVTSDGKGLQLVFDQVFRCNRETPQVTRSRYLNDRPTIRANGTFDYLATYHELGPVHGFAERHSDNQHITGGFRASGTRLQGRVSDALVGVGGLRCSSTITFSARKAA